MKTIKRVQKTMLCPLCGENHSVDILTKESNAIIKGENVPFARTVYVCGNCDDENEFIPSTVMDDNLMAARDAYRNKHHLLMSAEIVALRKKYDLSQKELAKMLGWGDVTISRYETKYIQNETHDELLRMVDKDPLIAKEYLQKNKDSFEENRFDEILSMVEKAIFKEGTTQYSKKNLEAQYVIFEKRDDLNGKAKLNISKICYMSDFFARRCKNLFKVKLMKLLWYSDALSYREYGHAISGLVYQHKPMGALPVGHYDLIALIPHEEIQELEAVSYKILPYEQILENLLTDEETEILIDVLQKFRNMTGQELADYMHKETAYTQTAENAYIPFTLAEKIEI